MLPQWGMGTTLAWRDHPICGENGDWSAVSTRIRDRSEPFFEPGDSRRAQRTLPERCSIFGSLTG